MEENKIIASKESVGNNQVTLEKIEKRLDRIEKHFTWNTIFGVIKAIIIIGPIVVGVIYLSPFVKTYVEAVRPFFETLTTISPGSQPTNSAIIPSSVLTPEIKKMLCNTQTREALVKQYCQ
ncbi:MAG: hypothetical protein C3F02_03780 [Parcubacteria group bacterium]|nr:MAG: hypothetical protein C3F02_03780 [Parcubacteria group bacterium]